eukprot:Gb_17204 [translate_table: standard]
MAPGYAHLEMGFVFRLNFISLGALFAFPLLINVVLPMEVLLDANQVSKHMPRIVMQGCWVRPIVGALTHFWGRSLQELPWNLMLAPMHPQVLIPLEPLIAYLAYISI